MLIRAVLGSGEHLGSVFVGCWIRASIPNLDLTMFIRSIRRLAAVMANRAGRRVPYILCPWSAFPLAVDPPCGVPGGHSRRSCSSTSLCFFAGLRQVAHF